MARVPNQFLDPKTGETYNFAINHNDETGSPSKGGGQGGLERNITVSAPTSGGIRMRQESARDPLQFSWKGVALTRAQHQAFLHWFKVSQDHTIHLTDFSGDVYEINIMAYIWNRQPVVQNRNDMTNASTWIYDWQLDIDVISIISGDLVNAGITA